mmetsp:Transcript_42262/g.135277  ORF Transcript_42262/g.135277 Transcript_42262/m.135277 type:complete len:608 (-) Transcript_42262:209-2032(-)
MSIGLPKVWPAPMVEEEPEAVTNRYGWLSEDPEDQKGHSGSVRPPNRRPIMMASGTVFDPLHGEMGPISPVGYAEKAAAVAEEEEQRIDIHQVYNQKVGATKDLAHQIGRRPKSIDLEVLKEHAHGYVYEDVGGRKFAKGENAEKTTLLLNPQSKLLRRWDINIGLLLVFTAVVTPFEVSFIHTTPTSLLFWINRYLDICFLIDMGFQFRIPVQTSKGEWLTLPPSIALHYFQRWFVIDLISIFPYDLMEFVGVTSASNLKALRVIRLMRLAKLLRIFRAGRMFQRWEATLTIDYAKVSLFKFVVIIMFLSHWMACAWHLVAVLEYGDDYEDLTYAERSGTLTWIENYDLLDDGGEGGSGSKVWPRYFTSLYWSVATLSTLGYGDVVPATDTERVFATLSAMLGATMYAYITGGVCSIVSGMDEHTTRFYAMMDGLNAFMKEKQLPQFLRVRLRDYFRFHRYNNPSHDWHTYLQIMSSALRSEVSLFLHSRWIKKVKCFQGCSPAFVEGLSIYLKTETFAINEHICDEAQEAKEMFIVDKGVVAVSGMDGANSLGSIAVSGGTFGEEMMFRVDNINRNYRAITLTNCVILVLHQVAPLHPTPYTPTP